MAIGEIGTCLVSRKSSLRRVANDMASARYEGAPVASKSSGRLGHLRRNRRLRKGEVGGRHGFVNDVAGWRLQGVHGIRIGRFGSAGSRAVKNRATSTKAAIIMPFQSARILSSRPGLVRVLRSANREARAAVNFVLRGIGLI